jgi:hypothetical protein
MNRCGFLVAAMSLAAVCLTVSLVQVLGAEEKQPNDVMAQFEQLRDRVAKLEARIKQLEKKPTYITVPDSRLPLPAMRTIPDGWQEREFNGMKYYLVPLNSKP